jgi:hypothetical protein
MKVILSVPDEGYSERTWWRLCWAYLMEVILSVPDEGYSERRVVLVCILPFCYPWLVDLYCCLFVSGSWIPRVVHHNVSYNYIFICFVFPRILSFCHFVTLGLYLMKVILSVPDEGYSERTWWRLFWANLMKVILSAPDEGYSERTWWRLFWAYLMKVITYLMKVITYLMKANPETCCSKTKRQLFVHLWSIYNFIIRLYMNCKKGNAQNKKPHTHHLKKQVTLLDEGYYIPDEG